MNPLFEMLMMSQNDKRRLAQCVNCVKDPDTCGATEKEEDEKGFCKMYERRTDDLRK